MHSTSQWNVSRTVGGCFVPSGVICSTTRRCPLRTTSPTPVVSDRSSRRVRGASPTNARSPRRARPPPSAPHDSELRFEATRDFLSSEVPRPQSWRAWFITMATEPVAWAVFKVRTISGEYHACLVHDHDSIGVRAQHLPLRPPGSASVVRSRTPAIICADTATPPLPSRQPLCPSEPARERFFRGSPTHSESSRARMFRRRRLGQRQRRPSKSEGAARRIP